MLGLALASPDIPRDVVTVRPAAGEAEGEEPDWATDPDVRERVFETRNPGSWYTPEYAERRLEELTAKVQSTIADRVFRSSHSFSVLPLVPF